MAGSAPLHPNLARVAASYDQVVADWSSGAISIDDARDRIEALVARDDQGVRWRIDLSDGAWRYETLDGQWVPGEPPTWGLATPGGWDLSNSPDPFGDPRRNITSQDVELDRVTDPNSIQGATIRAAAAATGTPAASTSGLDLWRLALIAVIVVVVVLGAVAVIT
jgi:hypothetical protein